MTKLSVNINKIATLRNARGGKNPDVVQTAKDCERFGAEGITIHPRPDQRHITTKDVYALAEVVSTEFNIEGYPDARYLKFIEDVKPTQATLVPDAPNAVTSNAGWDTVTHKEYLHEVVDLIKRQGSRVSIFVGPDPIMVAGAAEIGADRIELYTEPYASNFHDDPTRSIKGYIEAANEAVKLGIGINAGHDLNLRNLAYLRHSLPQLDEVSIGHALVCDALSFGLENTIQMYLRELL